MKINYIEKDGVKLFSLGRHDFQQFPSGEFIDGGFDYCRTNTEIQEGEIKDLIGDIRNQHYPGHRFSIKDMPKDDVINAIKIILTRDLSKQVNMTFLEIFSLELIYRNENKKTRKTKSV